MIKTSISGRLALMFTLAAVLIVSAYAFFLRASLHESLENQMHNELQFRTSLMEPWITTRKTLQDWQPLPTKFVDLATTEVGRVQYWILSDDPRFQVGGPPPTGVQWQMLNNGFNKVPGVREEACSLYLLITKIPASGERPALRYVVAIDSTPYIGTLNEFTRMLIVISIIGLALVGLLGFVIPRVGMKPVKSLSLQAQCLAPGNNRQRLDSASLPVELQQLASSFNGVLERQEVAWRQLESFNADVAHELRTPLTNLIGQTQLGLSREREVSDLEDLLESNLEELERMTSIVNDMLFLSHAQAGEHATQLSEVSLREEALKTAEYVEPSFAIKSLNIRVEGDVTVRIDRRLFHRSLANLLENSARHAHVNTEVIVTIRQDINRAVVAVTNVGESIDEADLSRLFERFYRVDPSRTQSDTHHGLGLSIVRAVALMHRGEVFATSRADSNVLGNNNARNTFGFTLAIVPE